MRQLLISGMCLFFPWMISAQITISEVMFDPSTDESADEFIEIYNLADSSVSLERWRLAVNGSSDSLILPLESPEMDFLLSSGSFAIILDPDYWDGTQPYEDFIPDSTPIFTIDDTRFGDFGLSNSSPRTIVLEDSTGTTISEYTYSTDNEEGYSDEKVILSGLNTDGNWTNSEEEFGTPGLYNSVSPLDYDLQISRSPDWTPRPAIPDSAIQLLITIVNAGLEFSSESKFYLYSTTHIDSTLVPEIPPGDSVEVNFDVSLASGNHTLRAEIDYPDDQDSTDNSIRWNVPVRYPENSLIINEIMYDPNSGNPEWVEIRNNRGDTVNIRDWTFGDESDDIAVIEDSLPILPNSLWVFSESEDLGNYDYAGSYVISPAEFPNLNNGSDGLWLRDMSGALIDSVQYSGDWGGGDGVSLERSNPYLPSQNPENWSGAASGADATPTRANSVLVDSVDLNLSNISVPSAPVEIGESITISGWIHNRGLHALSLNSVKVYGDADFDSSASTDELLESQPLNTSVNIGDSVDFQIMPIIQEPGFRQIILTVQLDDGTEFALLDTSIRVRYSEQVLLISEVMYTPEEEPEWIELYNASDQPVQLYDWKIRDATSNQYLIQDFITVGPEEYIVVTADQELTGFYDQLDERNVIGLQEFPTLNNSGDSVLVISPANVTYDSLRYSTGWGGNNGNSLERKNLLAPATNAENWGTSVAVEGATPGLENSITVPDYDLSLTNFSAENTTGALDLSATIRNRGARSVSEFTLKIFHDVDEDSIASLSEHVATEGGDELAANDSVTITIPLSNIPGGYQQFFGILESSVDTNSQNDTLTTSIFIGYPSGAVAINEIMYRPESGEPEWVELFVQKDSVDLRGFQLRDDGHSARVGVHEKQLVHFGDFVIIAGDSSILQSYPEISVNLEIATPFPTLNNGIDSVSILDGARNVQESLEYSSDWGGDIGVSLERINVNDSANAAFNWGSSAANNGATPGATNSIAILENDLRILPESIYTMPEFPQANNSWRLSVQVLNVGTEEISEFSLEVFLDSLSAEPWVSQEVYQNISPTDLVVAGIDLPGLPSGRHQMILRAEIPDEQRPSDNVVQFEVTVPFKPRTLLITEYAPIPGEGWSEFVEIYNPSDAAIDLSGWRLGDNAAQTQAFSGGIKIESEKYAVIAEDSTVYYEFGLQDSAIYLVPNNWRSLNNTQDVVRLIDPSGRMIDSLQYTDNWEVSDGKSIERKWYLSTESTPYHSWDITNWSVSTDERDATPGQVNSVAVKKAHSIQFSRTDTIRSTPAGEMIATKFRIVNTGLDTIGTVNLSIGFDENADSALNSDERLAAESLKAVAPADTMNIAANIASPMYSGRRTMIAEAEFGSESKSDFSELWIPYEYQSVLFNEFLADPTDVIPQEFIEVVNISSDSISLGEWNLLVNDRNVILDSSNSLLPKEYGVISEGEVSLEMGQLLIGDSWTSLPNDGGTIRLFDQYGYLMDSLTYTENWELKTGRSQERIHLETGEHSTSNWRASVNQNGATPGAENSLYFSADSVDTGWTISPSTFSPDGDGYDDLLRISYAGNAALQYATIRIFDTVGRTIKTLIRDTPAPVRQSWFWDGKDYKDRPAPIGMYLVHIEYKAMNGKQQEKVETIVLAKPL